MTEGFQKKDDMKKTNYIDILTNLCDFKTGRHGKDVDTFYYKSSRNLKDL